MRRRASEVRVYLFVNGFTAYLFKTSVVRETCNLLSVRDDTRLITKRTHGPRIHRLGYTVKRRRSVLQFGVPIGGTLIVDILRDTRGLGNGIRHLFPTGILTLVWVFLWDSAIGVLRGSVLRPLTGTCVRCFSGIKVIWGNGHLEFITRPAHGLLIQWGFFAWGFRHCSAIVRHVVHFMCMYRSTGTSGLTRFVTAVRSLSRVIVRV